MPVHFLSDADHHRLNRFPREISREELDHFFQLSDHERKEILPLRRDHNRLGFALQLCCLRFLGFFPDDLLAIPKTVIHYVAQQLTLDPELMQQYGQRGSTLRNHQRQIQALLGMRRATPSDLTRLEEWLQQRALEHDKPSLLFEMACDYLRQQHIIRIGTTRLEKLVSTARQQAQDITYETLQPLLSKDCRTFLDSLLEVDEELGKTRLAWLQRTPTGHNLTQMLTTLDKIVFLKTHSVMEWNLSAINANRLKLLARIGSRATNQYLKRANEVRRYPILLSFVKQSLYTFTDDLLEMFDQRLWELYRQAKRTFEKERIEATQSISHKLQTLRDIGQVLLDGEVKDKAVRPTTFKHITPEALALELAEAQQLIRPNNDAYVDYFGQSYRCVRLFSKRFLSTLVFNCQGEDQGILSALDGIRDLHAGRKQDIPAATKSDFIPETWRPYVFGDKGIDPHYFELATLWILRQQLRSGDIYVSHSQRFKQLERYLISKQDWLNYRQNTIHLTGTPLDPSVRIKDRESDLLRLAKQVEVRLNESDGVLRIEQDKIVLRPFDAEVHSPQVKQLSNQISARLPKLDITEVLIEVDTWTGFSKAFEHLHTPNPRTPDLLLHLYACLLAQCCNLDLQQMADVTGLTHQKLTWCNTWYIRDDTLKAATNTLINYHYHLPLSPLWGTGILSSSDGQRFPVKGKVRQARALPRYFGYGKGITFYTWTSDQFSQFGFKAIPSTSRDATYVLDEYLNNETELPLLEHTTDTAGYTDLIFALFDLLGLRFSPRLRDLGDQSLFRTSGVNVDSLPTLKPYLSEVINTQRIINQWDEILRLVGSLKLGWVSASLIIQKLQAYPRKHPLLRALQEYGRLIKTIHILRWYEDETTRRRLSRQLNKGEALHSLRSHLYFANQGQLKTKQDEQLHNQVGCLNLVTNLILIWNTVYMYEIVQHLRQEGQLIRDDDLMHIWPTRHAHINIYGKYYFNPKDIGRKKALRTIRTQGSQA